MGLHESKIDFKRFKVVHLGLIDVDMESLDDVFSYHQLRKRVIRDKEAKSDEKAEFKTNDDSTIDVVEED